MLKDKLQKNIEYFQSMEITNGTLIVKVHYPNKWGVYPSEDEKIKVAQSEDEKNTWFYYGNKDEISFEQIFDLIDNTIQNNEAAMAKLNLLNEKFNELKEIFASESLERLKSLKFVLAKKNKRSKRNVEFPVKTEQTQESDINNKE